jgi:hypothetical protein
MGEDPAMTSRYRPAFGPYTRAVNDPIVIEDALVVTGAVDRPRAAAVRVADGRIAAIGAPAERGDRRVDGRGLVVVPGLIDAHAHLTLGGRALGELDLSDVRSREEFEAAIARRHRELPADAWLVARGWSEANWPGQALPDRTWLAAAGARPAVCHRMDLHAAIVNDAVLSRCDLARPLAGGRVHRDAGGAPTGLMVEAAVWELVNPLVPDPPPALARQAARRAVRLANENGLVAVGAMERLRDAAEIILPLCPELPLRWRVTLLERDWAPAIAAAAHLPRDPMFEVIGAKAFIDGTLGSRTALMLDDYADDPGNRGTLVDIAADGRLDEWAGAVSAAGLSPSMHAIGDAAVRIALDAHERVQRRHPHAPAPRIEHVQHVAPEDLPRLRGVIASMQPLHRALDARVAATRLGSARCAGTFAFRSILRCGGLLAFGSDWPVAALDPIAGMRAAITGLSVEGAPFEPQERLRPAEALRAYTAGAASALGMHGHGAIEPGSAGDLTILDADPLGCDWVRRPPRVVMTIVGGAIVWDARA